MSSIESEMSLPLPELFLTPLWFKPKRFMRGFPEKFLCAFKFFFAGVVGTNFFFFYALYIFEVKPYSGIVKYTRGVLKNRN
jgi:hypothetical protein